MGNATFCDYKYILMSASEYISRVAYGKQYYSSLNNYTWISTVTQKKLDALNIIAYVSETCVAYINF